jgi:hypothetical protein
MSHVAGTEIWTSPNETGTQPDEVAFRSTAMVTVVVGLVTGGGTDEVRAPEQAAATTATATRLSTTLVGNIVNPLLATLD